MELLQFIGTYGLETTIIAFCVIIIIGMVKLFFRKLLEKVSAENKKVLYEVLSLALSVGITALWIAVRTPWFGIEAPAFSGEVLVQQAMLTIAVVHVMYPLYENLRLRDLFQMLLDLIVKKGEKNGDA